MASKKKMSSEAKSEVVLPRRHHHGRSKKGKRRIKTMLPVATEKRVVKRIANKKRCGNMAAMEIIEGKVKMVAQITNLAAFVTELSKKRTITRRAIRFVLPLIDRNRFWDDQDEGRFEPRKRKRRDHVKTDGAEQEGEKKKKKKKKKETKKKKNEETVEEKTVEEDGKEMEEKERKEEKSDDGKQGENEDQGKMDVVAPSIDVDASVPQASQVFEEEDREFGTSSTSQRKRTRSKPQDVGTFDESNGVEHSQLETTKKVDDGNDHEDQSHEKAKAIRKPSSDGVEREQSSQRRRSRRDDDDNDDDNRDAEVESKSHKRKKSGRDDNEDEEREESRKESKKKRSGKHDSADREADKSDDEERSDSTSSKKRQQQKQQQQRKKSVDPDE